MMTSTFRAVLIGAALFPGVSRAQSSVTSVAVTNYTAPGYVISADGVDGNGNTNRHRLAVSADFTAGTAGTYRVDWSLLNPADTVMATAVTGLGSIAAGAQTATGNLVPSAAAPLQPQTLYRVRAALVNTTTGQTVASRTESPGLTYLHLPGTSPSDAARNALVQITGVTVERTWLLDTDATKNAVPVTVQWVLHRYDEWTGAPTAATIPMTFTGRFTLPGGAGERAAATAGVMPSPAIPGHVAGVMRTPATISGSAALTLQPENLSGSPISALGLGLWETRVQAAHVEIPANAPLTGHELAAAAVRFLHFSGLINFGPLVCRMDSLGGEPEAVATPVDVPGVSAFRRIHPSGYLIDFPGYTFGGGSDVRVELDATGRATVVGLEIPATAANGAVRRGTAQGLSFRRLGELTLRETGAVAEEVELTLPEGVGWTADRFSGVLKSDIVFADVPLDAALAPAAPLTWTRAAPVFLCEQTKPFYIETASLTWDIAAGDISCVTNALTHSIRQPLHQFLASFSAQYAAPEMADKKSNDHFYRSIGGIGGAKFKRMARDPERPERGGGELTGLAVLTPGDYTAHLPLGARLKWNGLSSLAINGDLAAITGSSLALAQPVTVPYARHTADSIAAGCGGPQFAGPVLTPDGGVFKFTPDGGIFATGVLPAAERLAWGFISGNAAATPLDPLDDNVQRVDTAFPSATFLMAGTFVRGDRNPLPRDTRPAAIVLTGYLPDHTTPEQPGTDAYKDGLADYPGLNFRCGTGGTFAARTVLQGQPFGPFNLTSRSKYYARYSGVTGIHEPVAASFPNPATIGGYQFALSRFAFSYLDNGVRVSRTDGSLVLPPPVDFSLAFKELVFDGLGALTSLKTGDDAAEDSKRFAAWNAPFTPGAARFVATDGCSPGAGTTLVLGVKAHAVQFPKKFTGALGIMPSGRFAAESDPVSQVSAEVPRRLVLDAEMKFKGPLIKRGEEGPEDDQQTYYTFYPTHGAYLNNPVVGSNLTGADGFWSLFGTVDVPFFRDLPVQIHTRAHFPDDNLPLFIMGGWPDRGWLDNNTTPADNPAFDAAHSGWPHTLATLEAYRRQGSFAPSPSNRDRQWLPRATQEWLGLLNFDFAVVWNQYEKRLDGLPPEKMNLRVFKVDSRLESLTPGAANIKFGLSTPGFENMSVTGLANGLLAGALTELGETALARIFGTWSPTLADLRSLLLDDAGPVLGQMARRQTQAAVDAFISEARTMLADGVWTAEEIHALCDTHFRNTNAPVAENLKKIGLLIHQPDELDGATIITKASATLDSLDRTLDVLLLEVRLDPVTGLDIDPPDPGLLRKLKREGGEPGEEQRSGLFKLVKAIMTLSGKINPDEVTGDGRTKEEVAADKLARVEEAVLKLYTKLEALRPQIQFLRDKLAEDGEYAIKVGDAVRNAGASIEGAARAAGDRAEQLLLQYVLADAGAIDALSAEWSEQLRIDLENAVCALPLAAGVQTLFRDWFYDLDMHFEEASQEIFETLQQIIIEIERDLFAKEEAGEPDEPAEGPVGKVLKSGDLRGEAIINEDSLKRLDLTGRYSINEKDKAEFTGSLIFKELKSDGPNGCYGASGAASEVEIKATGVGLKLLKAEMKANLGLKFAFTPGYNYPSGIGGSFEMTKGKLEVKPFAITGFGGAMMISANPDPAASPLDGENYIAGHYEGELSEPHVAVGGGLFLGRTCSIDPLLIADPRLKTAVIANAVFGSGPFTPRTGLYTYGEAQFPIAGGSCFLNVSTKFGAGVFTFPEGGPDFGALGTLGVSGQVLCLGEIGAEATLLGTSDGGMAGAGEGFVQAGIKPVVLKFRVPFTTALGEKFKFKFGKPQMEKPEE